MIFLGEGCLGMAVRKRPKILLPDFVNQQKIIFIYLWKPQNIILNIVPEWLGKSQENFHTFLFWANLSTTGS